MGKKYIIELEDKPFHKGNGDFLYRVKGFNSLVFDMNGVGKLTPYTKPDLEQVRKEAYDKGYETAKYEYEQKQEEQIQVGDEYCYAGKYRCVITGITDSFYRILWSCGTSGVIDELTYMKPTGRHFPEIAEVLAKMKEKS